MSGRVIHFEVPFDQGERARDFYRKVFGWNLTEMPELDYTGVSTGPTSESGMPAEPGYIGGGLFERGAQDPRGPVIVMDVPDIDAALEKIESSGGATVSAKEPVGDMGFAAYFRDTEGNVLGLWENA